MYKNFGLFVGSVCLSLCSLLMAAPPSSGPQQNPLPLCSSELGRLYITADNGFDIYVDGARYTYLHYANNWTRRDSVPLPWYASYVAVKATDSGVVGGIVGSSGIFLTDSSWKCTNSYFEGWEQPTFDDSLWPAAFEIGANGVAPWGPIAGISPAATWIWTEKYVYGPESDKVVYCRKKFCQRCPSTGPTCIKSCDGLRDGPYQSCNGCSTFVICDHGDAKERFCPVADPVSKTRLKWRDDAKTCDYTSSTCVDCHDGTSETDTTTSTAVPPTSTVSPVPPCTTGPTCITSCDGLPDGDYQSCKGCEVYATCANGILYDERPCASSGTHWDDNEKKCLYESHTCQPCGRK